MAINYSTIKELLAYIADTVKDLEEYHVTEEGLTKDAKTSAATKYQLQTAIEACANIAEHLIFSLHLGQPENSKELFKILSAEQIIDHELGEKLKDAVGMHNILVHLYCKVDLAEVAKAATVGLQDLREFAKAINDFLEKNPAT